MPQRFRTPFCLLILAAAALLVYGPTLTGEFVWDGRTQVLADDYIHDPSHLTEVLTLRVLAGEVVDANRPAQLLSLMLDSLIWDKNPFGYRLTNLLLHLANAGLLFFLASTVLNARRAPDPDRDRSIAARTPRPRSAFPFAAMTTSLIFALHPLAAEPVSSPGFREDLLTTFFTLLALLAASRFDGRRWIFAAAALLCTLLALASKEIGIAAPVGIAAFYLLFRNHQSARPWLIFVSLSFFVALAFLAARFLLDAQAASPHFGQPVRPAPTLLGVLALQLRFWTLDLRLIAWPSGLSAVYGPNAIQPIPTALAAVILATAAVLAALWARRDPRILLGASLAAAAILPVSNIVPMYFVVADRYLYLPLAGLCLCLTIGLQNITRHIPGKNRKILTSLGICACALALLSLGFAARERAGIWTGTRSLWEDTIVKNPSNAEAHAAVGFARLSDDDIPGALTAWKQALTLSRGKSISAQIGLALGHETLDQQRDAEIALSEAIALDPALAGLDHPRYRAWTPEQTARLKKVLTRLNAP